MKSPGFWGKEGARDALHNSYAARCGRRAMRPQHYSLTLSAARPPSTFSIIFTLPLTHNTRQEYMRRIYCKTSSLHIQLYIRKI